jgi:FixJ family two-component response regulator
VSKRRPLIAVVDDEKSVCLALKRLLVSSGFEVESFSNGVDFIASLNARHPDCLVLDLHMPGMTGFDVQAHLTRAGDRLPIVTITGHDTPETHQRALDVGAVAYLRKPIDAQVLLEAIAKAIGGQEEGDRGSPD